MTPVVASVVYGVAAAIGWGVADLLAAAVSKRMGTLPTATGVHIVSVLFALPYFIWVFQPGLLEPLHWATLAGVSVLGVLVYIVFYRALQVGPVAIVSPIVSAYAVIVIALAYLLLGERLGIAQSLGAAASIGGVALASIDPRAVGASGRLIGVGALLAILTALLIGIWQYTIGILSRELGWFLPIYLSRLMTLALFAPMTLYAGRWRWRTATPPLIGAVIVVGVVETAALFAFARGSEVGIISIVAAASITYPVIPIMGGVLVFRERLALTQVVGLLITLAGLFVLAIAS